MNGVIACPQVIAAKAGLEMLGQGGSAVDAAVAAAFVQCVVDPLNASTGGFGVALVRVADAPEAEIVAFHGRAPAAARPDMFVPISGRSTDPLESGTYLVEGYANQIGYLAPTVPGTVKGLTVLLQRFGRLDLATVLAPAIDIARKGWIVTREHWLDWNRLPPPSRLNAITRFRATPEAARIYTDNGRLWRIGSRVINADYARTLERIATHGPDVFYRGDIARCIHEDFAAHGGLITQADLEHYDVEVAAPLQTTYRGYRVTSAPPPAGGLVVLEILNLLEGFDLVALGHNTPEYVRIVAEAMSIAFADMNRYLGDPFHTNVPIQMLLDKEYAANRRREISCGELAGHLRRFVYGGDTTQVTAVDEEGTCVSLTHSLGSASGVVTPGLGFMFNGAMHRFDPEPGRPNSIAPWKRRITGMAPSIIWIGERPHVILGGVGGNSIIVGVTQTILNFVDFGMDVVSAVSEPRFHCEGGTLSLEGRFPASVAVALERLGHKVALSPHGYDRRLGGAVYPLALQPMRGAVDPRVGGIALGPVSSPLR